MNINKQQIINNLCYTELVYGRINKKLGTTFSNKEIEKYILKIIKETPVENFQRKGKNYYITSEKNQIQITVNTNTFRVITVNTYISVEGEYQKMVQKLFKSEKIGDYNLINVGKAFEKLGGMKNLGKIIHIAGTNGKGSVSRMVYSCLQEAGKKVGIYTSPHLIGIRERFEYDGQLISKQDFISITQRILKLGIPLSYFEMTTLIGLEYFRLKKAEYIILEVGMGGRLDSTNIVSPTVTAITAIGLDHQRFLGETIEEISREKAGIIKQNIPVILYEKSFEIEKIAQQKDAQVIIAGKKETNLLGEFQRKNAGIAFEICKQLGVSEKNIQKGLQKVHHRGRAEYIEKNILVDGAHNIDSLQALKQILEKEGQKFSDIQFCIGLKKGKHIRTIFDVFGEESNYCFVESENIMLEKVETLKKQAEEYGKEIPVFSAEKIKKQAQENKNILFVVFGSLYMIGEFYR